MPITGGTAAQRAVYTNEIATSFDILKPEVWSKLMKAHGNQNAEYFSVIAQLGFKVASAQVLVLHLLSHQYLYLQQDKEILIFE